MPNEKLAYYEALAADTAVRVTQSISAWTAFLRTAARLYKYPFQEQLLIFAQRPDATACADYDTWNTRMRRYVKRGGNGIALVEESGKYPKLKYVFDLADTGTGPNSLTPYLWSLQPEHFRLVSEAVAQRFGVVAEDGIDAASTAADDLSAQLRDIFQTQAAEYWGNNTLDILRIVDNSLLAGYDESEIRNAFLQAAVESAAYVANVRCGIEPRFNPAAFHRVAAFNTPASLRLLGRAVSEGSEQVLRTIEVTVKKYERERLKSAERSVSHDRTEEGTDVRPGVLRGSDRQDGSHGRSGERFELSQRGRGLDSGSEAEGRGGRGRPSDLPLGRETERLPEGTPALPVSGYADGRNDLDAHEGRAGAGPAAAGHAGAEDGREGARGRSVEARGSDPLGRADEQHSAQRGGVDLRGSDLRISADLDPAEQAPGRQLSLFPTEAEQLLIIQEAESAQAAPFASAIPQEVIDDFLRHGSNTARSRMHTLAALFPKYTPNAALITEQARKDFTDFLRREYHGGYGIVVDDVKYAAWYDADGIHISRGSSARYAPYARTIPWNEAMDRIWRLYSEGRFATNVEAVETPDNERREVAETLIYLYHGRSETCPDELLSAIKSYMGSGYTDEQTRLSEALSALRKVSEIQMNLDVFMEAYQKGSSILRFHYHKLPQLRVRFEAVAALDASWAYSTPQTATELTHTPFITEDEIDEALASRGSGVSGGKKRIYDYFTAQPSHDIKSRADFLKNEYGTGGHSHALSGADSSWEDYDGKGLRFRKGDCSDILISWPNVVKRIETLIRMNRFLTPEEQAKADAIRDAHYAPEENIPEAPKSEIRVDAPETDNKPVAEETQIEVEAEQQAAAEPVLPQTAPKPRRTRVARNYRSFARLFPEIAAKDYR